MGVGSPKAVVGAGTHSCIMSLDPGLPRYLTKYCNFHTNLANRQVAGGDAVVKFVEGAPHGYQLFPRERYQPAVFGRKILLDWLKERL
jgi:hypothetical protein